MGNGNRWFRLAALLLLAAALYACPEKNAPKALQIGLAEEPRTLNVWLASDANSRKVLSLIYQPLYVYDPDTLDLVPWLAAALPVYDEKTMSYTVTLREARWSDGTPFTSRDVAFTGNLIQAFKVPRYASNWTFIKRIETPAPQTVTFYLKQPMAAFLTGTLFTPMVQEKEWSDFAEKAKTTEVDKVIAAMAGQTFKAPSGIVSKMDEKNHHLHKSVFIGEVKADGQFNVVWKTKGPVKAQPWSPFIPENVGKKDEPVKMAKK